jgi:hypothetical protein
MCLSPAIGELPYRLALAGGWIDQPFVSRLNPEPPGSMVVVSLEPNVRFMERCGMAAGTRNAAMRLWGDRLPVGEPAELVRELYAFENKEKSEPSGSQDMIGLIYPGISRLDYDAKVNNGIFPANIESNCDPEIARWLEGALHLIPVNQRPPGYNPLGVKNLESEWIRKLAKTGKDCFAAVRERDIIRLGASINDCMECWEAILPHTVSHPTLFVDLKALLRCYRKNYPGAMYSGCGGGYLIVVSEEPVPGGAQVKVRLS